MKSTTIAKTTRTTEEKLKVSKEMYRLLAEHVKDFVWLLNLDLRLTYVSPSMEKASGYTFAEMKELSLDKLLTEESFQKSTQMFSKEISHARTKHLPSDSKRSLEVQFRCKDGHLLWMEATLSFLQDEKGQPVYILGEGRDITESKKMEEKLSFEEIKFRNFVEHASDIIVLIDPQGVITYVNPAVEKVLGYTPRERIGAKVSELLHPDDIESLVESFLPMFLDPNAPAIHGEYRLRHKDGTYRTIETVGSNLVKNNVIEGVIVNYRDITERKRIEEDLKKSEERYRLLAEHTRDIVWIMDMDMNVTYISPSAVNLLGRTLEETEQHGFINLLTPASFKDAMDFYSVELPRALAAGPDYVLDRALELELIARDGHTVWAECIFRLIRDENGKPLSILGEGRNITERKQMENEMRASESNFRHSLDESPLGVRVSNIDGETIYANRKILEIYGFDSMEELKNTPLKERYTPETYAEWQARKAKRLQGEFGPSEYEISIVRKTGEIRHLHVYRKEIFWDGQKQFQVIYQDITLRRQAEKKLSETLESLRQSIKVTIQVLGMATEARDPYTAGHQVRSAEIARSIAMEMGLSKDRIDGIRLAGSIHDIGKLAIPGEILSKPTKLTSIEFSLVKEHCESGYQMLKSVESPWPLAEMVYQHHERMDGSGYPRNLKKDDIIMEARILAVADVVESMASHRPYRPSLGIEAALEEIEKNRGTLYDEDVVDACLRLFRKKGYKLT
ncbi:MAG: PAS domain S-box protein [Smithella sp.]|jgi:PAS domain S-box-containing protein